SGHSRRAFRRGCPGHSRDHIPPAPPALANCPRGGYRPISRGRNTPGHSHAWPACPRARPVGQKTLCDTWEDLLLLPSLHSLSLGMRLGAREALTRADSLAFLVQDYI